MKQKKRSGFSRILALLLVLLLAVNLAVPCFAATDSDYPYLYWDDTKTFETGVLNYNYDRILAYMRDSMILRALEFTGYDVQFLKDQKLLFHPDYTGAGLSANQYLLRDDPILTNIHYSDKGKPGGSIKTAETDWEKAWTVNGKVPNIPTHIENGMSCTSFVEYFYFAYLPNCEGKDVSKVISMYDIAHNRVVNKTGTYPDTWTEMFEGKGGLISQGLADHYEIELDASKDQTEAYNKIWRQLNPGAVIRFGNENSPYIHYAIYAGTYNNLHYVIHVGNNRGPEIIIAEAMAAETSSKQSWPIDFYDLKLEQKYGSIQVVKADADDDTKLAGAYFSATNRYTDEEYLIGPTNEKGYAIRDGIRLGTYDVVEVVPPTGYALDNTVHEVVLSESEPFATLYREITNKKSYGSLQILKNTNTGNNKAGWQFNIYKNSPTYSAFLTTDNSGQMFRVTVSDSKGNSVTSNAVSMEITPLKILIHPADTTVALKEMAQWTVTAQGEGLTYQWQYKNPGDSDWSVSSYNGTACWYKPTTMDKNGRLVRCVVTDKYGNSLPSEIGKLIIGTSAATVAETSDTVTAQSETVSSTDVATVAQDALAILTQPQSYVGSEGTYATFKVDAQGVGLTYVWEASTDGGKTWTRLTNPINDEPYETDSTGKYLISKIQTGNYFVQEIDTGKDGWEYDLIAKPVTVTANNTATAPAVVKFTNNETTGNLLIEKLTEFDEHLEGWEFAIYADAELTTLIADELFTDEYGHFYYYDLTPGTYWVVEVGHRDQAVEDLYHCISENPQEITIKAGRPNTVSFENFLNRGNLEIIKEGNNKELLAGAVFEVKDANGNSCKVVEGDPGHYFVYNVPYGTYTITEVTPPPGYEIGEQNTWTVSLSKASPNGTATITIINDEILGNLSIKKDTEDGKNLGGWIFNVYADADCSILLAGPFTTDANGNIDNLPSLKPGTVWVKEEGHVNPDIADLYYCNSNNPQSVEIVGHETATVTFENKLRFGSIEIIKISIEGMPLAGAKFLLEWSEDGENWQKAVYNDTDRITKGTCSSEGLIDGCLITDSTGIIAFTGLHPKLYYRITELEAPEGYLLLTDYVYTGQLPEDTLKLDFTVVNAKIFELPKTGSTSMTLMPVALLLSTATCVGVLLYLRKKKES